MNIGIVSPFNPKEVEGYLYSNQEILDINKTATAVHALANEFLQAKHHITIFTSYPMPGKIRHLKGDLVDIYMASSFTRIPKGNLFSRIFMVKRLINMMHPYIENLDVLHAHWTYDFALAAQHFCAKLPVFCTVRDWCPYQLAISKRLGSKIYWLVSYYIFKQVMDNASTQFIANSHYTYNCIKKDYPQKEVIIIPNPIKKNFILDKRKEKNPANTIFISISLFIEPRKNIKALLLAFQLYRREIPNSRLLLIGQDFIPDNKYVKRWDKEGLLQDVELCGWVDHDKLVKYLDQATALVHPSIEETFGNIFLEGMARCIPVIGGKFSGAVPDVLGHGKYGYLCDVTNVKDLYDTMCKINDIESTNKIVSKATLYLKKNYQSDVIAQNHIDIYKINKRDSENI